MKKYQSLFSRKFSVFLAVKFSIYLNRPACFRNGTINVFFVLQTPAGLQCQGRKKTKKLPKVPMDAFSFTTEILDLIRNSLSFLKVDTCRSVSLNPLSTI